MTSHEVFVALGYVGAAIGVAMVVPQIARVVRHRALPGVSTTTWAITVLACSCWLIYGLRIDSAPQIPGNILLISGAFAIVVLVPGDRGRRVLRLGAIVAVLITLASTIPAHDVGYLAFGVGLFSGWPQLFGSVRTWRAGITSGVSVSSWSMRMASQMAWIGYAIGVSDHPVLISSCVTLSTAGVLVGLELSARAHTSGQVGVEPELTAVAA